MEGFTRSLPSSPLLHLRLAKRAGTFCLSVDLSVLPRLVCQTGCHMVTTACSKPNTGKHAFAQFQKRDSGGASRRRGSQMAVSRRRQRG